MKLVIDKQNPEGKDKVHVHGEVNPVGDGNEFEVELDGSSGDATDVKTHVTNSLDGEGRPTKVTADPLTWKRGNTKGSKPRQKPKGWDYANSDIREGVYIRGHLLNDNIHGPGVNWNMVPITRTMNSTMEAQAESKGKEVTNKKNKIMFYEVIVDEYYTNSGVPEHIYFPKKITINWGDKMKGDKYDATGAVKQLMSKSFTQGRPAMPFNLNDLGLTLLQSKLGFDAKFATVVNELRKISRFASPSDFSDRINEYFALKGDKKNVKKSGMAQLESLIFSSQVVFDDAN